MKKYLFTATILFSIFGGSYLSSQENVLIPLNKPVLNPQVKEKNFD